MRSRKQRSSQLHSPSSSGLFLVLGGWVLIIVWIIVGGLWQFTTFLPPKPSFQSNLTYATPTPQPTPPVVLNTEQVPLLSATAIWLEDRGSQQELFSRRPDVATSTASLAKLMTALVAYESLDLSATVPIASAAAVEGNRAKFLRSDVFTVRDLLQSLLVFSANDAAQALANSYPGGNTAFVDQLNHRAQTLGLQSTHFANSSGLDHPDQYSTARELAHIADTALSIPFISELVAEPTVIIREQRTKRPVQLYTTNELLRLGSKYRGVKTGTTPNAGESLIFRYVDPPLDLLGVILGSQDRFRDARTLVQWVEETRLSTISATRR